ncbi:MAG: DUF1553 domain-containing protein [Pirellulales bacterium]
MIRTSTSPPSISLVVPIAFLLAATSGWFVAPPCCASETPSPSAAAAPVDFAKEVRPLLAQHCWSCHGPDETTREAGLRLDDRASALAARGDAPPAIVPGKPDESLILHRVHDADPDRVMPPPSTKRTLTEAEKGTLRRWIEQGANYSQHWAFQPVVRPPLPDVVDPRRAAHPIDRFVLKTLERERLQPAAPARRETLLRRLSLDLTGLPPSLELRDDFLADQGPDDVDRLTDRLLASPRHAERMAMYWLDAARFADTNGYNNDEERSMWPWRDWVIDAFRRQMPFDQFISDQMAGDLLPQPTLAQRVATAFHRNHVLTTEGGIIEEEYRVEYVADRVHTTSTVLLGLSLQCARCHDHKYDPFSQKEYYRFFAFFNQLPHTPVGYARGGLADPSLKVPQPDQLARLEQLDRDRAAAERTLRERETSAAGDAAAWESSLTDADRSRLAVAGMSLHVTFDADGAEVNRRAADVASPSRVGKIVGPAKWEPGKSGEAFVTTGDAYLEFEDAGRLEADRPFSISAWVFPTSTEASTVLSRMDDAAAYRGYDLILENGRVACHLIDHWPDNGLKVVSRTSLPLNEWHHVLVTYDGSRQAAGVRIYTDGKSAELEIANDKLRGSLQTDKPFHIGRRQSSVPFRGKIDDVRLYGEALSAESATKLAAGESVGTLAQVLATPRDQRTDAQRESLLRYYLAHHDSATKAARERLAKIGPEKSELEKSIPAVMVMQDQPTKRATHVLKRGAYDALGEQVEAAVPSILPPLPADTPANRLGLARWLFDPRHPLTSRVAVNRWWELYFGMGIVETLEDFGVTGAYPTHPELLDWLASELMRSDWDSLAMQRHLVSSATYRQDARVDAASLQRDPKNQWLARGPRYRLSAEMVRDNALAVAGLLVDRLGGPSVKPYQPEGLWEDVTVERRYKYQPDPGAGLYRRSMYTFWKRTCPPPSLSTFDAPTRETCTIRRARTNTPLQALVLLNDPTYVEAARMFAQRTLLESGPSADDGRRIQFAVAAALGRAPRPVEASVLAEALEQARAGFSRDPESAQKLLGVGRATMVGELRPSELAAWTVVCDMLLNLDETITKP